MYVCVSRVYSETTKLNSTRLLDGGGVISSRDEWQVGDATFCQITSDGCFRAAPKCVSIACILLFGFFAGSLWRKGAESLGTTKTALSDAAASHQAVVVYSGARHVGGSLVSTNCYILAIKRCRHAGRPGAPPARRIYITDGDCPVPPPVTVQIALTPSPTTLALRRQTTPEGALRATTRDSRHRRWRAAAVASPETAPPSGGWRLLAGTRRSTRLIPTTNSRRCPTPNQSVKNFCHSYMYIYRPP